jgi:carboxyl-terminal processing protease
MRERLTKFWLILISLLILSFSPLPGKEKEEDTELYRNLKLFSEAISTLRTNYIKGKELNVKELIYAAIKGMIDSLRDPNSKFLTPKAHQELITETRGEFGGLGMTITIKNDRLIIIAPIEDTPAARLKLQPNDWIIRIYGTSTEGMSLEEAVRLLRGDPGSTVTITIKREKVEEPLTFTITREIIKIKSVKFTRILPKVGYVRITTLNEQTPHDLEVALKKLKEEGIEALILDLRHNAGGLLDSALEVASLFLLSGVNIVEIRGSLPEQNRVYTTSREGIWEKGFLLVLVDKGTASGAEIIAAALQDNKRALILGESTFGKASVQTVLPLSEGALSLTTAHYFTPSGEDIEERGIIPDFLLSPQSISDEEKDALNKLTYSMIEELYPHIKEATFTLSSADIIELKDKLKKKNIELPLQLLWAQVINAAAYFREKKEPIFDLTQDDVLREALLIIQTRNL